MSGPLLPHRWPFRHTGFGAFTDQSEPPVGQDPDPWRGHRTGAAAALESYEERLRAGAWTALRTWLSTVRTVVLGGALTADVEPLPPDPAAVARTAELWTELVTRHLIVGGVQQVFGDVFAGILGDNDTYSAQPYQQAYLEQIANRWADLPDTVFDVLRGQLTDGMAAGESIPDLRDRISRTLSTRIGGAENEWAQRAVTMARTEVIGAYNGGTISAWRARDAATGLVTEKVWLATIDSRTRDDHFRADGQRRALDEDFVVGGSRMDRPGDPSGSDAQVYRCRCTMLEVEPGEELPDTADRQLADSGDVQAEIDRRADDEVVRAYDDPDQAPPAAILAAADRGGTSMGRRTWKGMLAPFGKPTGDGRIFKAGGMTARDLPLPLLYQSKTAMGHDGSVVVGRILSAEFTDEAIPGSGDFFDPEEVTGEQRDAVLAAIHDVENELGGVSVDLDSVVGSLVDDQGEPVDMEWLFEQWEAGENPVFLEQVDEGRLIAATMVATPAFAEAKIVLDPVEVSAAAGLTAALQDSVGVELVVGLLVDAEGVGRAEVTGIDEDAETVTVRPEAGGDEVSVPATSVTVVVADETEPARDGEAVVVGLTAAGVLAPPADWYEDPKLTGPTPLTVTDEGRVFGHVATWGTCHVGYPGVCVPPPASPSGYSYFHTGAVRLADGTRIAVGNLTIGGKHADPKLAYRSAVEHYDTSTAGRATVRAYEDEFGIAIAGAINPGTTDEQIAELERCPLSGDWREIGGELDMIGALAVNSGGFPIPRPQWSTGTEGQRTALVAAPGVAPRREGRKRPASGRLGGMSVEAFRASVARDVRADIARRARLDRMAATIQRDPSSRLAALTADVHGGS